VIRHCERSEAIQGRLRKNLDCFVANAPRNDEAFILSREAGEGHRAQRGGEGAYGAICRRRRVARMSETKSGANLAD
jgi:hypothetical protein